MNTKKIMVLLTTLGLFVLSLSVAYAQVPGGATVSDNTTLVSISAPTAEATTVEAGNISTANLDSNMSSLRWAGLLGNVTGNIVLGDAADNTLYSWTAAGRVVFASTGGTIDWGNIAAADSSQVTTQYAFLASGSDNYTGTFTTGNSLDSDLITVTANTTTTNGVGHLTYALYDTTNTVTVWAGEVQEAGAAYDGSTADYQMLLPEDGTGGDVAASSYNLWVELR